MRAEQRVVYGAQVGQAISNGIDIWTGSSETESTVMRMECEEVQAVENETINQRQLDETVCGSAKDPGNMHVFVKTVTGKTFTVNAGSTELILYLVEKIVKKDRMPMDQACLTHMGRCIHKSKKLRDYTIQNDDTLHTCYRVVGGAVNPDDLKAAFNRMESQMQQMQSVLVRSPARVEELIDTYAGQEEHIEQRRLRLHRRHQARANEANRAE